MYDTGIKVPTKYEYAKWPMNLVYNFLAKVEVRNRQIAQNALDDALSGYTVLILTYRINQIDAIYKIIQELVRERDDFNIKEVEKLYAKDTEDEENKIKERLEAGDSRILITTSQKFGEGSDVPCLSALHYTFPLSNKKSVEQIYTRITREHPTKKDPKITYYRDQGMNRVLGISKGWKNRMTEFGVTVIDPREENLTEGNKLTLWNK
jgi:superfamily II DNA or RNA helicase